MPVAGARISIVIDNNPSTKVILKETSPAMYTGTLRSLEPGKHVFDAVAFVGNRRFAGSAGNFTVERFSLEMLDSSPDPVLLGTISSRTGGISVTSAGIDSILSVIEPRFTTERQKGEHHMSLNPLFPLFLRWATRLISPSLISSPTCELQPRRPRRKLSAASGRNSLLVGRTCTAVADKVLFYTWNGGDSGWQGCSRAGGSSMQKVGLSC